MIINNQAVANTRKVMSGKDGALYNGNGKLLASMETYSSKMSVSNAKYQPLGEVQEHEAMTGYNVTLTFTEFVVEDNEFITDLFKMTNNGIMPEWNFQGVIRNRYGAEERIVYNFCVPSGDIDLQNVTVGDLVKRSWSLFVNDRPKLQGKIS